jgi:hypothetical protein
MLRFAEVKDIVRLVVRFVVSIVAALLVLVAGIVAVRWVTFDTPEGPTAGRILALLVVQAARPALLPAIMASTLICLFRLLRFSRARPAGLLAVLLLTGFAVTFGYPAVERLAQAAPQLETPPHRRLDPDVLYRADDIDLYALGRSGLRLETVVVHEYGREPAFAVLDEAVLDPVAGEVLVGGRRRAVSLSAVQNAYWQAFAPPAYIAGTVRDVDTAGAAFAGASDPLARGFLLEAWTLALAVTALWVVVRASRWPLLNILLALGLARGYFAVFSLADSETVRQLVAGVVPAPYLPYLLPGAFAAVSLLLLLVLILLPPFHEWKREVGRG